MGGLGQEFNQHNFIHSFLRCYEVSIIPILLIGVMPMSLVILEKLFIVSELQSHFLKITNNIWIFPAATRKRQREQP